MQFAETCDRVTTLLQNRLTPAFSPSINWRDNGPTTIVLLVLDYEKLPNHLQQLGERLAATAVFLNSHTTYSFVQHFSSNKDILTESTDKSRQLCGKDEQNWLMSSTITLNSYHIYFWRTVLGNIFAFDQSLQKHGQPDAGLTGSKDT